MMPASYITVLVLGLTTLLRIQLPTDDLWEVEENGLSVCEKRRLLRRETETRGLLSHHPEINLAASAKDVDVICLTL